MRRQSFGWWTVMAAALICVLALAGWSSGGLKGSSTAQAAAIQDIEVLSHLADGILEPQERLWVITVRGAEGMERFHGTDVQKAAAWMKATGERLADDPAYADAIWSVNVQGTSLSQEITSIFTYVEQAAGATRVESYEQSGTYSYSYTSSKLQSTLRSGDADIQLQAAAHFHTETKEWRVTLGTPAILIEY